MLEWLSESTSTSGFMPHGHCYLWTPGLLWLQVLTNAAIGLSYIAISATLAYLVRTIRDIPFRAMYLAFGLFIVSCGITHLFDVWVIWYPDYWLDGAVRFVTAIASVGTALLLPPLVPQAVSLARGAKAAHDRGLQLEHVVHDLERLYAQATELDELKTRLFANVSHELRTPLALLLGPLDRARHHPEVPEDLRGELAVAHRNATLLLRHVNDLLDVARLEAGETPLRRAPNDLGDLVADTASHFVTAARERDLQLDVAVPEEGLHADVEPQRIRRVLLNLLSNAFKFTPAGGRVRLSLAADGDDAVIEVADSGPGIPEDQREVVFERFHQLDGGTTRRFGGTGLGLPIVRDFVALHGGTVQITEAPEGGALFTVRLPLRAADAEAEADARTEPGAAASESLAEELAGLPAGDEVLAGTLAELDAMRSNGQPDAPSPADQDAPVVLVAEDNADLRRYLANVFGRSYRVVTASDGAEALATAEAHDPTVVVSDLMMPGTSGDELLRRLRAHPRLGRTPLLMLTARTEPELRVELLRAGADDWVVKPFHPDELLARVDRLAREARLRERLQGELDTSRHDLDDLFGQLAEERRHLAQTVDDLKVARKMAEQASRFKTSLLRTVSHELRSPLNLIGLQLELMRRLPGLTERQADLVSRQRASLDRMGELVEGLLQKARIEGEAVQLLPESFDLTALVAEVVDAHGERARGVGVELSFAAADLPLLHSDPHLVRVVVQNLVGNALKFTPNGAVRVQLSYDEEGHTIAVDDTGSGIAAADLERIFEPFVGSAPVSRKHQPGLGLGLSLVRDLVHALGGQVSVRSEPNKGSTFTVVLPHLERGRP